MDVFRSDQPLHPAVAVMESYQTKGSSAVRYNLTHILDAWNREGVR
jgi:hypothetical protein